MYQYRYTSWDTVLLIVLQNVTIGTNEAKGMPNLTVLILPTVYCKYTIPSIKSFHFKVFPAPKLGDMVYISFTEKLQFPMSPKPVLFPPQHTTTSEANAKLTRGQGKLRKCAPLHSKLHRWPLCVPSEKYPKLLSFITLTSSQKVESMILQNVLLSHQIISPYLYAPFLTPSSKKPV